jgi:C-terminal processing protease CtpA/Prc
MEVDGVDVSSKSAEEIKQLLRGEPDTTVSVSYTRPTDPTQTLCTTSLTRSLVKVSDVNCATLLGDPG